MESTRYLGKVVCLLRTAAFHCADLILEVSSLPPWPGALPSQPVPNCPTAYPASAEIPFTPWPWTPVILGGPRQHLPSPQPRPLTEERPGPAPGSWEAPASPFTQPYTETRTTPLPDLQSSGITSLSPSLLMLDAFCFMAESAWVNGELQ